MRIGIHLPQYGQAFSPAGIQRAAKDAEEQGFSDVWVSDHLVVPAERKWLARNIADPLIGLAFAAAVTEHIGLGTSVLVAPQYPSPLQLANTLASLDAMSGGRLTVGFGIGWSRREYDALGASYRDRGARLDEVIRLCRTVWDNDPASFVGRYYPSFRDIHVLPAPAHRIPIWIGGRSTAAVRRALDNDGYHAIGVDSVAAGQLVEKLRSERADEHFTVSVRLSWAVADTAASQLNAEIAEFQAAGVDAVVVCPDRGDIDAWRANQEALAEALRRTGGQPTHHTICRRREEASDGES